MTKQVRKLDAIIQAIRDKERVLVTRLTVVKKLCENPEAASAFALFIARKAQERLRDKKAKDRYRQLANRAVKEMKSYLDDPTEDGKWRLLHLLSEIKEEQNEYEAHKLGRGPQHRVLGSPGRREGVCRVHATGGSQVLALSSGSGSRWQFGGLDRQVHPEDRGDCSILATVFQDQRVSGILGSGASITRGRDS